MITSSPGPTPAATSARWSDVVPFATATPCATPQKAAKSRSNCPMKAPSELIQPERMASTTLAISSSPITGAAIGMRGGVIASPCQAPGIGLHSGNLRATLGAMTGSLRSLARRLLGVARHPTYYLPWIIRPGLECALLLSNVEARFKPEYASGPFRASVVQYDAQGAAAHVYAVSLQTSTDAVELPLKPAA